MNTENGAQTSNMKFRKFAYIIGNFFCMTPWYDFEKFERKNLLLNKVCAVAYGIILVVLLFLPRILQLSENKENLFEKILASLDLVILFFLLGYLVLNPVFFKQRRWECYLKKFTQMMVLNQNICECKTCKSFYVRFIVGHIYFLVVFCYSGYEFFNAGGTDWLVHFICIMVAEYYCFLHAVIAGNLALIIGCFYKDLNGLLERQTENYVLKSYEPCSEEKFVNSLRDIGKQYRHLSELIYYYNEICGLANLLIFGHSIIQILRCSNLLLWITQEGVFSWTIFVLIFPIFAMSMGETVYITLSCDQASSSGRELSKLCYKHQEMFQEASRPRKEFFKLASIAQNYKPKFTAANFFIISRGTLLGIINISTTYLIVIIQFYGTIREKYWRQNL